MIKQTAADFAAAMGLRIKAQRESLGLSQDELAIKLGYKGKASISRIESGANEIPTSKLLRLADIMGTSVAYLMGWASDPSAGQGEGRFTGKPKNTGSDLTEDEIELLAYYRKMNDQGKLSALLSVKGLSEQELFKKVSGIAADG